MIGVLGPDSALYTGPRTTCASEMNFVMNIAPGAGPIAGHIDQQSSALPLYHGRPLTCHGQNKTIDVIKSYSQKIKGCKTVITALHVKHQLQYFLWL